MEKSRQTRWGHLGEVRDPRGRPVRFAGEIGGAAFEVRVDGGRTHGDCRYADDARLPDGFPTARGAPLSRLLARLDVVADPGGPRSARRIRERLAPKRTLDFLDLTFVEWDAPELRAYHAATAAGRRALAIGKRFPSLARILVGRTGALTTADSIVASCRPVAGQSAPAHEARVLGLGWVFEHPEVLSALLALPWDWVPATTDERAAFARVVRAVAPLTALLGSHDHLHGSRGRWQDYEGILAIRVGMRGSLATAVADAMDMAGGFTLQAAAPLLAASGSSRGWARPYAPEPFVPLAAARVLLGGKGVPAILEASARWHRRQGAIDAAIGAMGEGRGVSWPLPFAPVTTPLGIEAVALATQEDLRLEGGPVAAGGLSHCVGGYGRACSEGRSVVVSLRRNGRRLSTLELDLSGPLPRALQHKAASNADPGRAEAEAAHWLIAAMASGVVRIEEAYRDPAWRQRVRSGLDDACGFDWRDPDRRAVAVSEWGPHLPRPLRDAGSLATALAGEADAIDRHGARRPGEARAGPAWILNGGPWYAAASYLREPLWHARRLGTVAAHRCDPFLVRLGRRLPQAASERLDGRCVEAAVRASALAAMLAGPAAAAIATGPSPLAGAAFLVTWAAECRIAAWFRKNNR